MDPFVQLSYSEQCPQKTAKPQEIALINYGKVSERFWFDLLERKCPEGLGEVSKGLVNDKNLTPEDFLDDLNTSPDAGASQQTKISHDCYTDIKQVNGDEFKTPVTSRYSHKITETPSLFSQDESTICSPTSRSKSQPTGHGDERSNQAESSPDPSQTPTTPMGLSKYKIGSDWSARRSTTPDILAEILGQRESTLSRLLAGGHEDEITEWSESMATPPLKTTEPAGDPSDCQTEGEKTDENLMGEEGLIPAKRIARVLFSGCIADQSIEAMELSLDEVKVKEKSLVPLKNKDLTLPTAPKMGTADSSLIEEEFVMQYSCHEESKRSDVTLSEPLPGISRLTSSSKRSLSRIDAYIAGKTTYFSPPSAKTSMIHSPLPNNFLSPKSQSPFQVLAQSTPKQSFKDDQHKVKNRPTINDEIVSTYHDTSLPRDTNMHNCSLDQLCDISKTEVHATSGNNSYADELDCKLEVTDGTFGSPSRSFELAMAREADKLCSGIEKDSRTSGLGSSSSVSLNAQSQNIDDELIKNTVSQPTDCSQETAQIARNGTTLQTVVGKNITISSEPAGGSLHYHSNYLSKSSFDKVPGIRRSARTKGFSYSSASQVAEHRTRKSIKRTFTNDDVSSTVKEENSSIREEKGAVKCEMYDDSALCTSLNSRDSDVKMPLSKRLKFEGLSAFCKSVNDLNPSPKVNSKENDVFLYDMDALTQFPMECICSPPLGASRPRLEKKEDVKESARPGELVFCDGSKEPSSRCAEEEELQPVYGNAREISGVSHSGTVASVDEGKYPSIADEIVGDDDQVWENNLIKAGKLKITALHGPQSKRSEPTQADNCQYFGRFSPEKTGVYVSRDYNNKSFVTDGTSFTGFKTASGKHVSVTLEALEKAKATVKKIDDSLGLCEGESKQVLRHPQPEVNMLCNATQSNGLTSNLFDVNLKQRVGETITSDENLTVFEKVQSPVLPGFCGFSTASGHQIHISQSAMRRARKTLGEVDIDMKASRIVHDKGVEKAKEDPCFFMERGERAPVNGLASADNIKVNLGKKGEIPPLKNAISDELCLQEKTCTKTNRIAAFSSVVAKESASGNDDPDCASAAYLPIEGEQCENAPLEDRSEKNSSTARAGGRENKDITLKSPTHVVGGFINKNGEDVHDSLLEDLLNDFKCKRRDSLIAISEESDKVKETEINTISAVNSSCKLRHKLCNDEYSLECNGNVLTEILPDDAGKNTAWCTSIKVASISTSEETTALGTTMQSGENIAPSTSFFGFQTSSGQKVKLSAESMEKDAAIMREIDNSIQHNKDTTASPTTFSGFHTASGKLVKLSAESMEKGAVTMQNIDNSLLGNRNTTQTSSTFSGFQTASGQKVKLSKRSMEKGATTMQEIENSIQHNKNAIAPLKTFSGFQTASGQLVKLSAESVEKGAAIIQKIDNSFQRNRDTATSKFFSGFQTGHGQLVKLSAESMERGAAVMQKFDNSLQQSRDTTAPPNAFSGFQTANGQQVTLSEESMKKGASIMQQIDYSIQKCKEISAPSTGLSGFQTASSQKVKISAESMEKGTAIMQEIDSFPQQSRKTNAPPNAFSAYQTVSGQKFKLSEESVEKGATTMQQIHNSLQQNKDISTPSPGFSGFQTANGQQVTLSKESMKKDAVIMQQIDNSIQLCKEISAPSTGFSGFQTASGQKVKISAESMEKGTAIMQEIDNFLQQCRDSNVPPNAFSGFQTVSGQKFKLSEESAEKGASTMQQIHNPLLQNKDVSAPSTGFSGFQTASGQKVKLSAESMKKGTAIMQEIDNLLHRNKKSTLCEKACGQKVNFEKQSIGRGMAIMREIDKSIEQNKGSCSCVLFGTCSLQTASEKSVKYSKECLENGAAYQQKADQSFQKNVDGNEPTNCSSESSANVTNACFSGFQTANGKTVQISESALAKAKDTMASIENDIRKSRSGTERILADSLFKRVNAWKPAQDTDTLINNCHVVTAVVPGRSMPLHDGHRSVEHNDAVSREILESSEALLAYESSLDVSEYDKASVAWDSLSTSAVSMTGSTKGLSHFSKEDPQRRHSTPLSCGEDMLNRTHRNTRTGMKPCSTTPSGVFHDRRIHFRAPLRALLATVENTCTSRGSDSTRSLNPLRATTSGCFKTKHSPSPRTSTPLNANAMHRTSVSPPLFITPYRNREVSTVVSPLARCSSSSFPVSESPKPLVTDLMVPSAGKAKVSSLNWSSKMKCGQLDTLSKCNERVKPQSGFLSGLRRHNQRIKLKDYVGIGTLPGRHTAVELLQLGLSPEVISVTSTNAVAFRLCGKRYFSETALSSGEGVRTEDGGLLHIGSDGCIGLEEIQSAFLTTPGVDSQLISEAWIANHYRWLVWKLAAMEVAFPYHFAGRCLTPDWLLCQLKFRYDKEIDSCDRSALKKIMERDDVSSRTMVLCVSSASVTDDDTEKEALEHNDNQGDKDSQSRMKMASCAIIEVTDGWYSIRAILDRPLTKLLHNRNISVGQKLIVCGAELVGSEQAVSPLEAPSTLMLRLHANSTRRARWDVKLGFHDHTLAFPLPLSSLIGDGGFTGCVDIIVLRQYPVQWMEKMPDGTNVFRNSRLEETEAKKFEADRHQRREKLFLKIQEEFEKECLEPERERRRSARCRRRSFVPRDLKELHDGKEIYEALSQATDPAAIKECLDERQIRALEEYQRLLQERKFAELQSKFERTWREQEEECQSQRNVVPLLKVRIADYLLKGRDRRNAVLSIWRPSEEVMQLLSEGSRLRIYHLTASGVRYRQGVSEVQLSATRTTRYQDLSSDLEVKRIVYVPRKVCPFPELRCNSSYLFSEVDLVGLVIFCPPLSSLSSSSSIVQTVYLSDEESNIVAIKFWGGLKAVAVEDVVKAGNFICCSNLAVRQDDRLQCPFLTFGELSNVSLKPREPHLRNALKALQESIQDLRLFMSQIQEKLDVILYPNRASLPENLKVDTVRVHRQSSSVTSSLCQNNGSISSKATEALLSTGKEISPSLLSRPSLCIGVKDSHRSDDPSLETPNQAAHEVNPGAKLRHTKRKLLESIPEPPPLSPLPNFIPASVRREFKKPRRAESSGNIHRKQ